MSIDLICLIDTKAKRTSLLFILIFGLLTPFDYSVWTTDIPEFSQLNVSVGSLAFGVPKRSGAPMFLETDGRAEKLLCRADPDADVTCIKAMEQASLSGKKAKVWWHEADIYGNLFLKEKRVLQLEVNGTLYISYDKQKQRYIKQISFYPYIFTMITFISVIIFSLLQMAEKPKSISQKNP